MYVPSYITIESNIASLLALTATVISFGIENVKPCPENEFDVTATIPALSVTDTVVVPVMSTAKETFAFAAPLGLGT